MHRSFVKPVHHSRLEAIAVRVAFAAILWVTIPPVSFLRYTGQPRPNGLAKTFEGLDFTFLSNPDPVIFEWPAYAALRALAALALLVYALGFVPWLTLTYVLAFFVSIGTLYNSQGSISHHMQLVAMTLVGIVVYHLYHRIRYSKPAKPPHDPFVNTIRIGQLMIAGAYVSSAISKISAAGFIGWIQATTYFPVALVKAGQMHYYNNLTSVDTKNLPFLESFSAYLGELLINNPGLAPFIIGPGLIIEAFAFVLLFGRRWNTYGAIGVIVFHLFVGALMNLHFDSNVKLIAAFFILPNLIYWLHGRFQNQPRPTSPTTRRRRARA